MDQFEKVTVLLPAYNVEAYIDRSLASITNQTYPNLEIIVVNDGSTDSTLGLVEGWAARDPRIRVIDNTTNLGIVGSLNRGLAEATGVYVCRMDGDDVSELDRVERQVAFLKQNPEIALVGVSLVTIDSADRILGRTKLESDWKRARRKLKYGSPVAHVWTCKTELYRALGGYRPLPGCEDYDFLLRLSSHGYKFCNIGDYFGYRVRVARAGNTINAMGIRQERARAFAYKLYKEHRRHSQDSFSDDALQSALKYGRLTAKAYALSASFIQRAVISRATSKLAVAVNVGCACLIYPPQLGYLYRRLRMKAI